MCDYAETKQLHSVITLGGKLTPRMYNENFRVLSLKSRTFMDGRLSSFVQRLDFSIT
jgi:hypothetical protein